ncbi:hypothetical protein TNCV_2154601 [Trichonephila clavipes]|nr:hypothetical protein TNCV_2154601 [Trichonephila clavipes]
MVREGTGAPNEGVTYVWMVADEAVGCTRAFLTMWWSLDDWSVEGVLSLVFVKITSLGSTGSNTSSQHNQSGLIDGLLA